MKSIIRSSVVFLAATLGVSAFAYAEVFKCKSESGAIRYSDTRCDSGYRWNGKQWISVEEEKRQKLEKERLRREAAARRIRERLQAEAAAAPQNHQSSRTTSPENTFAPNPSDIIQAERFLTGLPSECSSSYWYPAADGTVNIHVLCGGTRLSMDGLVAIKDGMVRKVR
ncbi:hypothetical protein [Denitromonas ohlonensis]|uniref:DUF4124 domain-containing protein n=2 Tax=Denitromonas TaxID=139331 RepID=A0A557SF86_9RHOO|nr:hypothetical protein [Denitromonas ohlonensis]TVO64189.1 hypothetical protein FHP90_12865 [Denitromonas ohlonensis]TVO76090.1 hypothetical protein FHP89_11540 [Denitromonas ohlonensis]